MIFQTSHRVDNNIIFTSSLKVLQHKHKYYLEVAVLYAMSIFSISNAQLGASTGAYLMYTRISYRNIAYNLHLN